MTTTSRRPSRPRPEHRQPSLLTSGGQTEPETTAPAEAPIATPAAPVPLAPSPEPSGRREGVQAAAEAATGKVWYLVPGQLPATSPKDAGEAMYWCREGDERWTPIGEGRTK